MPGSSAPAEDSPGQGSLAFLRQQVWLREGPWLLPATGLGRAQLDF